MTIELVIKIPAEQYNWILISDKTAISEFVSKEGMMYAIKNGIPIPKGHGRLIDADAFGKELHRYTEAPYQYALKVFNDAPTIIEADNGDFVTTKRFERIATLRSKNAGRK